jgi:hypothetical protein
MSEAPVRATAAAPREWSEAGASRGGLPRRERHRLERVVASHGPMDTVAAGYKQRPVAGGRACGRATS